MNNSGQIISDEGEKNTTFYRHFIPTNFFINNLLICLFFFVIYQNSLFPQSLINHLVKRGLEYSYDFNWGKAEDIFKGLIKRYPADPRGYHYEASIYLWYYLSNQNVENFQTFISYSDTAITKANKLLEKYPNNTDILYTLGSDYSYRAIAFIKAQKFLDAVWASKKSESYLNETLAKDSTKYDSYLGLGLYNFAVGQIPSAFKWALNLAGINGNVDNGLMLIHKAAEKGNLDKVEAEYYSAQILSDFLDDYNLADKYLTNLTAMYPGNLLFRYSLAVLQIKKHNLNEAKITLTKILKNDNSDFKQLLSFSEFLKGDIFFKENQFDSAKTYYLDFLNHSPSNDYKGIAAFRLAVSFEITGNRTEAVKYYELTGDGNMDLEDDIYAKRIGEIFSKRTMAYTEMDAIRDENMIGNGKYKAAFDSLTSLLERIQTDRLKAEVYLDLSDVAYYLGKYDESINFALTAKVLNTDQERWIKPYACYYAARAEKKLKNNSAIVSFVEEAKSYSDYDYQKKLKNLLIALTYK
ncbi:MAG: tetratricopeptide repeat protein [Ignavibacteriaceae bacterium]